MVPSSPDPLAGSLEQGLVGGIQELFLHFLGGLPEKHIGADGGPQDGDDGRKPYPGERYAGQESGVEDGRPRDLHHEHDAHVCEQAQTQPFQVGDIPPVGDENLQAEARQPEAQDEHEHRAADQQVQTRSHGADIRADVDGVGQEQEPDGGMQHPLRKMLAQAGGQTVSGDPSHLCADFLDAAHQGIREHHGPQHAQAELAAHLGVCGDAAGVVVGGAGDDAGTDQSQQAAPGDAHSRGGPFHGGSSHARLQGIPRRGQNFCHPQPRQAIFSKRSTASKRVLLLNGLGRKASASAGQIWSAYPLIKMTLAEG